MRRIGHRGAMGHARENTIESFEKAHELGCDEVETDVWLASDGRLLVSHEPPAADATLTLDQVLDACRGRMTVNVEVKSVGSERRAHESGARVAHLLASRQADAYVSSFWWAALEGARAAVMSIRRAFVFADSPDHEALVESSRGMRLFALHPNRAFVTPELVKAIHVNGIRVQAWTVNDPPEIATFREWGVDGIMSDFPERVPKD